MSSFFLSFLQEYVTLVEELLRNVMSFAGMSQCIKHCQEMSSSSFFFTRTSQWVQYCLNFFLKSKVSCRVRHIGSTVIKKIYLKNHVSCRSSHSGSSSVKKRKEKNQQKNSSCFLRSTSWQIEFFWMVFDHNYCM